MSAEKNTSIMQTQKSLKSYIVLLLPRLAFVSMTECFKYATRGQKRAGNMPFTHTLTHTDLPGAFCSSCSVVRRFLHTLLKGSGQVRKWRNTSSASSSSFVSGGQCGVCKQQCKTDV